ncbi:MAG TPA: hypothetical protein VKB88_14590 [Bryobacteraceae bacterium]|nr:hypothetical protein [Bryobacteraceae bacterium]
MPIPQRDHPEFYAVDEVCTVAMLEEREADDDYSDTDSVPSAIALPIDLRDADDAEGLLEATGWQVFTSRKDSDSSPSRPGG